MNPSLFIARKIKFKGRIAMFCIAVSFLVIIIAVSVSSGFRVAIRDGISTVSGDIMITPSNLNYIGETSPIEKNPAYLPYIESVDGIEEIKPVITRAGVVNKDDIIHGVMIKGIEDFNTGAPSEESLSYDGPLPVSVPYRLASILDISLGDDLPTYFVGEKVKVRKFKVTSFYHSLLDGEDKLIVYADLTDMQRLNGWDEDSVSAFEITVESAFDNEKDIESLTSEIGSLALLYSSDDEASVVCTSSVSAYPQLFDWLNLIDFNVVFVLVLMIIVAGFNMISGLLILLFENIPTIGILKAVGMKNSSIAGVFLISSSSLVLKGMAIGNVLAFLLCFIQAKTHLIALDPVNYFVSYIPVHLDIMKILAADLISYVAIMLLLLLPSVFVAKVDPATTIKVK